MSQEDKPKITKATKSKQFTQITFQPDLSLFGMTCLDDDTISLMQRRVYDVAGITDETVRVYWNDEKVNIRDFHDYVKLFNVMKLQSLLIIQRTIQNTDFETNNNEIGADERMDSQVVYGVSPRWQFAVIATPTTAYLPFSVLNRIQYDLHR